MLTRDQLKDGALRAYERGRLRTASRVGWLLVPVALVCALETGAGEACACLGALLFSVALYLRWRDRKGVNAVSAGLFAGSLPLVLGLVLGRLGVVCEKAPLWSVCAALCLAVGIPSGVWLGARATRGRFGATGTLTALGIAVLSASMGCAGLGLFATVGTALGLALGATVTLLPQKA